MIILNYLVPRKIIILYLPLDWGWEKYLTYPNSYIYNPTTVAFLWLHLRQSVYLYDCLSQYMCLPISVYLSLLHLNRSLLIANLLQYLSVNLPPSGYCLYLFNCLSISQLIFLSIWLPIWSDLAKFHHFGNILLIFVKWLRVYSVSVFGNFLSLLCKNN